MLWISLIPGPVACFHPVWSLRSLPILSVVNKSDKSPCQVAQLSNVTSSIFLLSFLSTAVETVALGFFNLVFLFVCFDFFGFFFFLHLKKIYLLEAVHAKRGRENS